ncbi:hypothetical protein THAOC_27270 [Thalassiosira oceanica]|uniref:Uncharacterized protein n=1 Tax=Thalassiosira oceanica TaxID=159749 RepID=K0RWT8_THAOC|nr:hypothetical protein THAOC_27270 [Thalassiosira oceanica]|eukprot:EJK53316.1 hypothetical protein THAOC_27270 [Thalassiosira oceanica]
METKSSKKRRLDEGPSANNGGVVTMEDVQRLIDQRVLQAEQATQREQASMRRQVDALEEANAALKNRCHWLNQGHGDQYIAEMTKLVKQIKKITEKLRNGAVNDLKQIAFKPDVFLAHDDILLPHWSELSDAIQLRGEGVPLSFVLINVQMDRSVKDMLSQSLVLKCEEVGLSGIVSIPKMA